MNINEIEIFLYNSGSDDQQIYSFLNFLYTNNEESKELSTAFFNAFENAYTKESIIAILNQNSGKDDKIGKIIPFQNTKEFHDQIYKVINAGTKAIKEAHKSYLGELKPLSTEPIKYIIIGEAPPFSFTTTQKAKEIVLEFKNNYILSKKNAGIWQSSIRGAFGIAQEEKGNTPVKFIEGLVANNILFFDIIPVTLPFSTDIRKGWISKEIDNKPLLISLLDLAIKKNVDKLKEEPDVLTIDPNVKVAFVTPPKTSISIFDYYSDKKLKITDEISVDITIINDNTTKKKYNVGQDIILPMYKANAMMGANAPSTELLKLALDK